MATTGNFSGGIAYVAPIGQQDTFTFVGDNGAPPGTWTLNGNWSINLNTDSGSSTIGDGNLAQSNATCGITLANRVYMGAGLQFLFSALADATLWEQQDTGAGYVNLLSQYGQQDAVTGLATFQGHLAVYGRYSTQVWQTNADPLLFGLLQTLPNTGTIAPLSVQSLGDSDVLALADFGVWSLRVRDASGNGTVIDMGSPIALNLQQSILTNGYTASKSACAVVEPSTNRYWLYLNSVIYTLSYFPTAEISAWSTYEPTANFTYKPDGSSYDGSGNGAYSFCIVGRTYTWVKGAHDISMTNGATTLTATGTFVATSTTTALVGTPSATLTCTLTELYAPFVPKKFVVYQGQIFARATFGSVDRLVQYGGTDNNTYDTTKLTVETPWMHNKMPATNKASKGVDIVMTGTWLVAGSMDYAQTYPTGFNNILTESISTPENNSFHYSDTGTHVMFHAETSSAIRATLSSIMWHYNLGNEKT